MTVATCPPRACRLGFVVCGVLLLASAVDAAVEVWHIGKGGVSWTDVAQTQTGALDVNGALQPLELAANRNLVELLRDSGLKWLNGQPTDFVTGGQPRTWSNDGLFNQVNGPLRLLDGRDDTHSEGIFKTARNQSGAAFFFDLGAAFPINRIRFFPTADDPDSFIKAFELLVSDGESFNDIKRPEYRTLRRVEANRDAVVDLEFATLQGRFLELRVLSKTAFNLAEFEVFGEGFVPLASYVSELHSFGRPVNYGSLRLHTTRLFRASRQGEASATAKLQLRTGADATPLAYFRRDRDTGSQVEVDAQEYNNRLPRLALFKVDPETGAIVDEVNREQYLRLTLEEQGPVRDFVQGDIRADVDHWSPWSQPLVVDSTGTVEVPVGLPSPREFMQFRVFFDGDADNAIRLDTLMVDFSPELVSRAVGEIALADDPMPEDGVVTVVGGVDTGFVYGIRTEFEGADLAGYRGVRLEAFPAPVFQALLMGDPPAPVAAEVVPRDTGFDVLFDPVTRANNRPLRIAFRMRVLEHNTPIQAWLLGGGDDPPQPVAPGDASDALGTNVTNAFTVAAEPVVEAHLSTSVLTPNGDGVNDGVGVDLILSQFAAGIDVDVDVRDLAGRRVRRLVSASRAAGVYPEAWDGRDDGGQLVPPGLYLLRVEARSDAKTFHVVQTVAVVY